MSAIIAAVFAILVVPLLALMFGTSAKMRKIVSEQKMRDEEHRRKMEELLRHSSRRGAK